MNSEKVWLICFANLHFIKLHFCTMSSKQEDHPLGWSFSSVGLSLPILSVLARKRVTGGAGYDMVISLII